MKIINEMPSGHPNTPKDKKLFFCTNCKHTTGFPCLKGNGWIEFILWISFIPLGLVYSIWRRSDGPNSCPACKKDTLVRIEHTYQEEREEIECVWCAEKILAKAKICKHCGRDVK